MLADNVMRVQIILLVGIMLQTPEVKNWRPSGPFDQKTESYFHRIEETSVELKNEMVSWHDVLSFWFASP
jgi:hypothetical protein